MQRINQGLDGYLTLISAPVGYGKTTLAAEWAGQAVQRVAWLSLDEDDNDAVTFLTYLIAAVRTLFPEACPDLTELLRTGRQPCQLYDALINPYWTNVEFVTRFMFSTIGRI